MTAFAQASDPLVGTWKLNAAKSKGRVAKSGTTVVEAVGKGVKLSVDLVDADGLCKWGFTAEYDGEGQSRHRQQSLRRCRGADARRRKYNAHHQQQGGKVTGVQTIVVSGDGKTRTTTTKGTGAKGEDLESVAFYEKQ